MSATVTAKHECARCGKRYPAEQMVYSRFTGNRYCGFQDLDACDRRTARRARTLAAEQRGDALLIATAIGDRVIKAVESTYGSAHPLAVRLADEQKQTRALADADAFIGRTD